jgi:hypothetical protein
VVHAHVLGSVRKTAGARLPLTIQMLHI